MGPSGNYSELCRLEEIIASRTVKNCDSEPSTGSLWWCLESMKPLHLKRHLTTTQCWKKKLLIFPKKTYLIETVELQDSIVRNNIIALRISLRQQFRQYFSVMAKANNWMGNPFTIVNGERVSEMLENIVGELTELSCEETLKSAFGQLCVLSPFYLDHISVCKRLLFTCHHKNEIKQDWCWGCLIQTLQDCVCRGRRNLLNRLMEVKLSKFFKNITTFFKKVVGKQLLFLMFSLAIFVCGTVLLTTLYNWPLTINNIIIKNKCVSCGVRALTGALTAALNDSYSVTTEELLVNTLGDFCVHYWVMMKQLMGRP